jgi:hypothetical protein
MSIDANRVVCETAQTNAADAPLSMVIKIRAFPAAPDSGGTIFG